MLPLFPRDSGTDFGGIAQLVERLNGIQEVRGPTPLTSTKFKTLQRNSCKVFSFLEYLLARFRPNRAVSGAAQNRMQAFCAREDRRGFAPPWVLRPRGDARVCSAVVFCAREDRREFAPPWVLRPRGDARVCPAVGSAPARRCAGLPRPWVLRPRGDARVCPAVGSAPAQTCAGLLRRGFCARTEMRGFAPPWVLRPRRHARVCPAAGFAPAQRCTGLLRCGFCARADMRGVALCGWLIFYNLALANGGG